MKVASKDVDRNDGRYVNRSAGKNVSMYAYKRGAGKSSVWMDGSVGERLASNR